jgi:hypothetical protein
VRWSEDGAGRARLPSWTYELTVSSAQVFVLLVFEMALFMMLVVPLPFTLKRKIFT